ncbi:efflux RND transporter permease subunit [Alkalilimnicola sp. S0819]|uniref:efflux RND transporter permease subunit n=1 Tax=Alkalilimnicola sp. S0819 TaxID=2613922 RepID=UPI001261EA41|nr:efflux RND transporter permease subunit [Alkalilimnicola sp. S0819]KAB7627658.1 efflux RND transporter permease subunit [Alkalilimnicola sp. S0819]MPQ15825.1 MMPL family transporter [Alkalilimnicola sp. S0819]
MAEPQRQSRGVIGWIVEHRVAPNLLLLVLILGGLFMSTRIQQEVFPPFETEMVTVKVAYPGATPEQIEQGILLPIESAVQSIAGIKEMRATASEGSGTVRLELLAGTDQQRTYQEIEQAVARIDTFPDDAERPRVAMPVWQREVMDVMVYGEVSEHSLREAAEQLRDALIQTPGITQVELQGVREYEIHINVDAGRLRAHGLSIEQLSRTIADNALDRSAGRLRTDNGRLLLQMDERRARAEDFADLVILQGDGSALLRLGDVAELREGFADSDQAAWFEGKPAINVAVYRMGEQTPIGVSQAVREALPGLTADLAPAIETAVRNDRAEIYRDRLQLLLKNAFLGLMLVLVLLSIFLEFKLAFWVTVGIPASFLGAMLFLPGMGVSINMVSMFAFIVALGIVVDDAIVAGENIYEYRQRGMKPMQAAIQGARDIAIPVIFAVLTNIVAFLPMALIPGHFGQIWAVIPAVVGTVFAISLVEALIILPSHLGHVREGSTRLMAPIHALQQRFSRAYSRFIEQRYGPLLRFSMNHRYITVSLALALLLLAFTWPMSGRMGFMLMPRVESDAAAASAELPQGASREQVAMVARRLDAAARQVIAENGGERLSEGVFTRESGNNVELRVYLTPPEQRPISTTEFARLWRQASGELAGVESLSFLSDRGGPGSGAAISLRLSHRDTALLNRAAQDMARRMQEINGVTETDDGYRDGNPQWSLRLSESGRALGLSANDIASQVRGAFFGAEAIKQLRGRNEVTVRARLAGPETWSPSDVRDFMVRTPAGTYVPLTQVARIEPGLSLPVIQRENGRRTLTVTADVEPASATQQVLSAVQQDILPALLRDYPGLSQSMAGRQASMQDAVGSFFYTATLALLAIYVLLAIPFRSYIQPLIIMIAIPFGAVGAILGHLLMGYSLSLISIMGMIALSGVVVNGSLVMIDYANARRREGRDAYTAMALAGVRRFRPIMLTTLTTFGGLAPMIFETSRQARFMIPMAISLGYGILFATAILLLLVPSLYMIIEDCKNLFSERLPARGHTPSS